MSLLEIQQDMAVLLSRATDASESLSNIEDRQIRTPSPDANLLQQLADMKTMMETMRMEKMQQENKHKAEVEAVAARLHAEQQEARELTEIQTTLLSAAIPPHVKAQFLKAIPTGGDLRDKLFKHIQASEHILYIVYHLCELEVKRTDGDHTRLRYMPRIIITDQHVYSTRLLSDAIGVGQEPGAFLHSGVHYMSLYTFDKPLQLKQIKMLSILKQPTKFHKSEQKWLHADILTAFAYNEAPKEFESVIRLIPGSYQNGDWRPMDGFFGLYFNETTMEVNEFPGRTL